jgi:membrane dipeptidase
MTDSINNIIVDGHQDIAWNALNNGRDFRRSAHEHRRRETDPVFLRRYGCCMVGLPEEIEGRIAVTNGTIYVSPAWSKMFPDERILYETPEEAYRLGKQQLELYHTLADSHEQIRLIKTQRDLDAVLDTWRDGTEPDEHVFGIVLLMEGADPIIEPEQVGEWYTRGLRVIGPAWSATRYSGGTKAPGPLTDLGRELLRAMRALNMILDLSHMAPEACYQALDFYDGPLFASHANPLRFRPDRPDRHLSDEIITLIAEHDGAVGIMPCNGFLVDGWKRGDPKEAATMDHVIMAIDHVCQLTGSAHHAGIGSDFDGGFGSESTPVGFETVADLPKIGSALAARGYTPEDIAAVLSENFLRILRAGLPGG